MYKRYGVQSPPIPKTNWCLGLIIKTYHQEQTSEVEIFSQKINLFVFKNYDYIITCKCAIYNFILDIFLFERLLKTIFFNARLYFIIFIEFIKIMKNYHESCLYCFECLFSQIFNFYSFNIFIHILNNYWINYDIITV